MHSPRYRRLLTGLALALAAASPLRAQTSITGTWPGTWSWTSCPPAFGCSVGTVYTNVTMILAQNGSSVTGSVFSGGGNTISNGTLSGSTFSFRIDYTGRTDVYDTCVLQVTGDQMSGPCIAHYTSGAGTYFLSASRARHLSLTSGDQQTGTDGTPLGSPLTVKVTDASNNPLSGVPVSFQIAQQPTGASGASLTIVSATTGATGTASTALTLGNRPGQYQVSASCTNCSPASVTFTETGQTPDFRVIAKDVLYSPGYQESLEVKGGVVEGTLHFQLGQLFSVQVFKVNPDGSTGDAISLSSAIVRDEARLRDQPPPGRFKDPHDLFPNDKVLLQFTKPEWQFLGVHKGTCGVALTFLNQSVTVPVTVERDFGSGWTLGSSDAQGLDRLIAAYADLHGIPPQLIKAHASRESGLNPFSYRYEPLTVDYKHVSRSDDKKQQLRITPLEVPGSGPISVANWRLETFADTASQALPQGIGFGTGLDDSSNDVNRREELGVQVDAQNTPLKNVLPPDDSMIARRITAADTQVSAENLFWTNNTGVHRFTPQNWFCLSGVNCKSETLLGSTKLLLKWIREQELWNARNPRTRGNTPDFTAQTVIAASYGLMQVLYQTAVLDGWHDGQLGMPPSGLFDPSVALDLGTEHLARLLPSTSPPSSSFDDLMYFFELKLVRYNCGNCTASNEYSKDVRKRSQGYYPHQQY